MSPEPFTTTQRRIRQELPSPLRDFIQDVEEAYNRATGNPPREMFINIPEGINGFRLDLALRLDFLKNPLHREYAGHDGPARDALTRFLRGKVLGALPFEPPRFGEDAIWDMAGSVSQELNPASYEAEGVPAPIRLTIRPASAWGWYWYSPEDYPVHYLQLMVKAIRRAVSFADGQPREKQDNSVGPEIAGGVAAIMKQLDAIVDNLSDIEDALMEAGLETLHMEIADAKHAASHSHSYLSSWMSEHFKPEEESEARVAGKEGQG